MQFNPKKPYVSTIFSSNVYNNSIRKTKEKFMDKNCENCKNKILLVDSHVKFEEMEDFDMRICKKIIKKKTIRTDIYKCPNCGAKYIFKITDK